MEQKNVLPCVPEFSAEFSAPLEFSGCVTEKHLSTGWARTFDLKITFLAWVILKNSMGDR
jgi:hypothetical protein